MKSDKDKLELEDLLRWSREYVQSLTPAQYDEMIRQQGLSWAKAEVQWAKDYREGKCECD
jgi:hypothetical protein